MKKMDTSNASICSDNGSHKMDEDKLIKVDLSKCQSMPKDSLLFVDVSKMISNMDDELLLPTENNPNLPLSDPPSSNGSLNGQDTNQRKRLLPSDTLIDSANRLKSYFFDDNTFKSNSEDYLKTKILGMWHSMRYGWAASTRTNFSKETPICMFGKAYHRSFTMDNHECSNIDGFKRDFRSVLWLTYRQKFPVLEGTNLTSDCGWGCMIRTGQMMIAAALRRHLFPKGWSYSHSNTEEEKAKHRKLISWFSDFPSHPSCPFSIHNLVKLGNKLNKLAGNWYGPSCISHIFKDAFKKYAVSVPELRHISVIVSQDGGVYLQDIIAECSSDCCTCPTEVGRDALTKGELEDESNTCRDSSTRLRPTTPPSPRPAYTNGVSSLPVPKSHQNGHSNGSSGQSVTFSELCARTVEDGCSVCHNWRPCIILVPMRLGSTSVNSLYYQCLLSLLLHNLCIGIIGGRPKHSLYFVGFQDKHLIHLDPHLIQDTVPLDNDVFDVSSFHCSVPRKMSISKMDPSSAVGFFCPTKHDFIRLVKEIPLLISAKDGNLDSSLFEFIDSKSPLHQFDLEDFESEVIDSPTSPASPITNEELVC